MNLDVPDLDSLGDLSGKRVLVRADYNVPVDKKTGAITDDTRISAGIGTLRKILDRGGRPVVLVHFGRPDGEVVESMRVGVIGERLQELLGSPVLTLKESTGPAVEDAIASAPEGTTVLCENVRFHKGETKGDPELARAFARLGDVFVGDAFGAAHRDHASVSGVARLLPSAAGDLLAAECRAFAKVLTNPERPLVAILGGAKVSDKLTVIDSLLDRCDALLIGGGMAYTFLKVQGHTVGASLVEEDRLVMCQEALAKAEKKGVDLILPVDHVVADRFAADAETRITDVDIPEGLMALDIGPKTREVYADRIRSAQTVIWNGPMGVFELEAFRAGTESVGKALAECKGTTVVGGGDSVAAIHLLGLSDRVDHVSTGGGASLELLEGKVLPGIEALGPASRS
ncbi:Phosphoglycerate kinase [Planctomycetes bacterium Poly30]|uniref:Phosphoglycerate kinase n=1 Tax=Saltatorellus ferox TaxID=2528018 RepID=A0A518ETP8_9BACT|nr:Phosphoglycerate kinase [Planctomycetes bacterium Poly30]